MLRDIAEDVANTPLLRGKPPFFVLATAQIVALALPVAAQFGPPTGYYDAATGNGLALRDHLHNIIDDHTVRSYGDARSILQVTDRDPLDSSRILLAYDRVSLDVSTIGGSIPGWDSGQSWNREHTWPRSLGVGSSGPDNSDLHQLRPSTPAVNSSRSNLPFGGEFGQAFGRVNDGGLRWYPGDAEAGLIARQQFYTAVRYDGSDSATSNLELTDNASGNSSANLFRLVEWHYLVAPDDFELRRNHVIFSDYQGNRNPFVDHPEFVWSVFVDQENDSRLSLAQGSTQSDGGFLQILDLGRHYVNQQVNPAATVRVEKSGNAGTYASVTGSGIATASPAIGRYAFATGGTQTLDLQIGPVVDTSAIGTFSGTLTIDNLDITQEGGAGAGANDPNDTVELRFDVLAHPVASFSLSEVLSEISLDLGFLPLNATSLPLGLSIVNYGGLGSPQMAASLDLDAILGSGDLETLNLNLPGFRGLLQGDQVDLDFTLNATNPGSYSSSFELVLSGEDLPGEQTQSVFLNLEAEVVAGNLPGDFNLDGSVDTADYAVWRDLFGQAANLANGVADDIVDRRDYNAWVSNLGATLPMPIEIPEPTGRLLLLFGTLIGLIFCGRKDRGAFIVRLSEGPSA